MEYELEKTGGNIILKALILFKLNELKLELNDNENS